MTDLTAPWFHSLRLWFLTNVIGTLLVVFITIARFGGFTVEITLAVGGVAALYSLPIIALVVFAFNRILGVSSRRYRLLLVFFAITGLWLMTALINISLLEGRILYEAFIFSPPYYFAALLATGWVYRPWLFTQNE